MEYRRGANVMRRHGGLFLQLLLFLACGATGERTLVWEDEFDGDSLDGSVWAVNTGNGCDQGEGLCGWGNFEKQTYTRDNHQIADGVLMITAEREAELVDDKWYTSSRIRSKSPISFLTGRIESRIRLPTGLGLWAAFWMLPSNTTRGEWAATGEIDIMEAVNDMDTVLASIHYGGEYPGNRFAGCRQSSGKDFSSDYHVYAIEWEQGVMRWYVDDQLYCLRTKWTSDLESFEPYRAPFDTEFELLLNLAVGGSLPGRFVDDSIFPASMLVDYVRVYDISDDDAGAEPYLGVPACLPGVLEAEAYDVGGLGLGYGDTQPEGASGSYRIDGVGLVGNSSGRFFLDDLQENQWTAYSVMTEAAEYTVTLEVSTAAAASFSLVIGDAFTCANPGTGNITGVLAIDATGESGVWGTTVVPSVTMPEGSYSLKLCIWGGLGTDVDKITFNLVDGAAPSTLTSADCAISGQGRPYMFGEPWAIPGYIEAEFYDLGGPGVGFYETSPIDNFGSNLRWPDGVDVIEAESNPAHGQYVGNWAPGEWLAFSSRAEEAGFWDVGASVAVGFNGSSISYRLLVNATNCSSAETDGYDGLGSLGVDLLNGPVQYEYTGSWEAFEMAMKEEVWVPQGEHRVLFCADSGLFNLNYLRFWTPTPTPAPTPVPSPAPTAAPQVPSDEGTDTKWIYISVALVFGFAALSRLGCIVYAMEKRRRNPSTLQGFDSGDGKAFGSDQNPPTDVNADGGSSQPVVNQMSGRDATPEWDIVGDSGVGGDFEGRGVNGLGKASKARVLPLPAKFLLGNGFSHQSFENGKGNRPENGSRLENGNENERGNRNENGNENGNGNGNENRDRSGDGMGNDVGNENGSGRGNLFGNGEEIRNASGVGNGIVNGAVRGIGSGGLARDSISRKSSMNRNGMGEGFMLHASTSSARPTVSPVESLLGVPASNLGALKTPRAKSGLEVANGGSLWDRSTMSPIQPQSSTPTTAAPLSGMRRDQFEDALVRALDSKWENNNFTLDSNSQMRGRAVSRAQSFSEGAGAGGSRPNAMLAAGRCWTCVCTFENTVGQTACLGCGRIAPIRRPKTPLLSRNRMPPHRMQSWIPPPMDV